MKAMVSPKRRSTFTGHDVIPQKTELFISAAVRISDPVINLVFYSYLHTIYKNWTTFWICALFDSKGLDGFSPSASVSPANSHFTNCSTFLNHPIIGAI
jgi:hypothetical protein